MRCALLPVLLLLCVAVAVQADLSGLTPCGVPQLIVTRQAGVHVVREATMALPAGGARLAFDFAAVGADPASARLDVLSPAGVQVVEQQQVGNDAGKLAWVLQTAQPANCKLRLVYGAKNLSTGMAYVATLNPEAKTLTLDGLLTLRNGGPEPFPQAEIVFPDGQRLQASLPLNETVQQRLLQAASVPYESRFVYDNARFKDSVHALLRLPRQDEGPFSRRAWQPGPIRIFLPGPGGLSTFLAEAPLPYAPAGEAVELDLGIVPDIIVTRTRVKGDQVNVKSDIYRKAVLFDLEEQFDLQFENRRPNAVNVLVQERIAGQWEMLKQSQDFVKRDAGVIEFTVAAAPGAKTLLGYTVRRLNVEP